MAVAAFDTHRIVKRLKDVGFTESQAETVSDVLAEARALDLASLVTKVDLAELRAELRQEFSAVRAELKQDIANLRSEMAAMKAEIFKWLVTLLLGQAALIVTLIKLL